MGNSHPALVDIEVKVHDDSRVHLNPDVLQYRTVIPVISYESITKRKTTWCYEKETDTAVMFGGKASVAPDRFEVVQEKIDADHKSAGDNSGELTISGSLPDRILNPIKDSDYVELWIVDSENSECDIGYAYLYPPGKVMEHNQH